MNNKAGKSMVTIPGMEHILIQVVHSNRKTLAMEVTGPDQLVVRAPMRYSEKRIAAFLLQHEAWLRKTMKKVSEKKGTGAPAFHELSQAERENIRRIFRLRVLWYCDKMGVAVGKITIRSQKTRWGSCSNKGNVNFNYQLAYMPEELLDYVVVHELAHRIYMNHSDQFWQVVERYDPDYREHRRRLKEYTVG